jgi:hypothetical protein
VSSICNQSFTNWEMLLIDDGSTDGSEDLCDQFAASDPRIRVFHKPNGGVSSARNFGLRYASGDYILFVDSDDFLLPGALSCLRNVLQQHPRCDILQFGFQEGENTYCSAEDAFRTAEDFFLSGGMPLRTVWGSLFRKSIVDGIQFPDGIPVGEDTEFSTRCYFKANYIGVISRPLYHYRITAGSAIRSPFSPKKVRSILSVIHNLQDSIRPRNSAESRGISLGIGTTPDELFPNPLLCRSRAKKTAQGILCLRLCPCSTNQQFAIRRILSKAIFYVSSLHPAYSKIIYLYRFILDQKHCIVVKQLSHNCSGKAISEILNI